MSKDHDDVQKREALLRQTAAEYANYMQIDTTVERAALDRELESMLTRLEEYGTFLERTRAESRHTLDVLVPQVYSHYQSLQRTFQTVDQLAALVARVKNDLSSMENAVAQAEADLGLSHSFTTVIKPLFFKRDQLPAQLSSPVQMPSTIEIFKTEDYFDTSAMDSNPLPDIQ